MASARDNLARQNIFIPASHPEEQITLRVAAYCRVSSDSADQLNSFAAQNTHYNTVISTHDHPDVVELNKRISDISNQIHTLTLLNKQGIVESDYFISKNNQLAEQLRKAKQQKEKLLDREDDEIIRQTKILLEVLEDEPEFMDQLDEELFCELIDKIIVESNTKIRFRLKNGLELPESIERTVR